MILGASAAADTAVPGQKIKNDDQERSSGANDHEVRAPDHRPVQFDFTIAPRS